jgi:iron complex outermembrane receptor protein
MPARCAGTANRCSDVRGQDLFPEQSYDTANLTGTFDFNETFTLFGDAFYSKRDFVRRLCHATLTVPQTNAWFVLPVSRALVPD